MLNWRTCVASLPHGGLQIHCVSWRHELLGPRPQGSAHLGLIMMHQSLPPGSAGMHICVMSACHTSRCTAGSIVRPVCVVAHHSVTLISDRYHVRMSKGVQGFTNSCTIDSMTGSLSALQCLIKKLKHGVFDHRVYRLKTIGILDCYVLRFNVVARPVPDCQIAQSTCQAQIRQACLTCSGCIQLQDCQISQ